jgi:hypothetical protein
MTGCCSPKQTIRSLDNPERPNAPSLLGDPPNQLIAIRKPSGKRSTQRQVAFLTQLPNTCLTTMTKAQSAMQAYLYSESHHYQTPPASAVTTPSAAAIVEGGIVAMECTTQCVPEGFPPGYPRVSWDSTVRGGSDRKDATIPNIRTDKRLDVANNRTAHRITVKDRINRSTTGEFPRPRAKYFPGKVNLIFPTNNFFNNPGPDILARIASIMLRQPPTPSAPLFRFGITPANLEHNVRILADANFNFTRLIPEHQGFQGFTLGFGSEFRPLQDPELLLSRHPHFPFVARVLTLGMDYHFQDGQELAETERLAEMAGQLQRGNHKSVSQALDRVKELLAKDVTHGFTIPLFPVECAPQIKGGMIQPLGVVKQSSLNEHNEIVEKFRLT